METHSRNGVCSRQGVIVCAALFILPTHHLPATQLLVQLDFRIDSSSFPHCRFPFFYFISPTFCYTKPHTSTPRPVVLSLSLLISPHSSIHTSESFEIRGSVAEMQKRTTHTASTTPTTPPARFPSRIKGRTRATLAYIDRKYTEKYMQQDENKITQHTIGCNNGRLPHTIGCSVRLA